jgi:hypothetical protein
LKSRSQVYDTCCEEQTPHRPPGQTAYSELLTRKEATPRSFDTRACRAEIASKWPDIEAHRRISRSEGGETMPGRRSDQSLFALVLLAAPQEGETGCERKEGIPRRHSRERKSLRTARRDVEHALKLEKALAASRSQDTYLICTNKTGLLRIVIDPRTHTTYHVFHTSS